MDCLKLTQERYKKLFQESAVNLLALEAGGGLNGTNYISTGSESLDSLIGIPNICGITKGAITEVCGFPGNGKTQFWYELFIFYSVNASFIIESSTVALFFSLQTSFYAAAAHGKVIYIDTKGGFSAERFKGKSPYLTFYAPTYSRGYLFDKVGFLNMLANIEAPIVSAIPNRT